VPTESEVFPMSTGSVVVMASHYSVLNSLSTSVQVMVCLNCTIITGCLSVQVTVCLYSVHSSLSTFGGELHSSDGMALFPAHSKEKTLNSV
jgi:hypothetical protein